jgi:signal transduction histidine kinase
MEYLEAMGTTALDQGHLAEEQAALRRVATLVASGASSTDVFNAVAQEVAQVLHLANTAVCRYEDEGTVMTVLAAYGDRPVTFQPGSRWPLDGPSMSAEVLRTGRPVRFEDYSEVPGALAAEAREYGFVRVAGAPIIVDGRVWGVISTSSTDAPLPDRLEDRLADFTELVATAIANSQAHEELARLAEEQAALRRVATLVAQGAPPADVFKAVSAEVARLAPADGAALTRFESDGTVTAMGGWTLGGGYIHAGTRYAMEGTVSGRVFASGAPERVENYAEEPGQAAAHAREMGWRSSVGAPITVEGRLWGALAVVSTSEPLPPGTERKLAAFTELVATAVANAESREDLTILAAEQAALRRVATLVAQGASPAEVFEAVSTEVGRLIPGEAAGLASIDAGGMVTPLGTWTQAGSKNVFLGERFPLEGRTAASLVFETCRPARIEGYDDVPGRGAALAREAGWQSTVAAPIIVDGGLWGVVGVSSTTDTPLPADTERRLMQFTELVATAIANAQSHEALAVLADEQSALRRVATLVAEGASPDDVFAAVGAEVARTLGVPVALLFRYDADGMATVLSTSGDEFGAVGTRLPILSRSLTAAVYETGRAVRIDDWEKVSGLGADFARERGLRWGVGVPIVVDGDLWGVMTTASRDRESRAVEIELRLAKFTELLATAIANAESRAELDASRARIVATADATRRRFERDLHDGAQQQLLSLALEVRAAQAGLPQELSEHRADLAHVAEGLTDVLDGLREIALGLHPAILAEGGLGPALKILAHRSPIPVELDVGVEGRLPEHVEVTAYYLVSETLTNAAKHAQATAVRVVVDIRECMLHVLVSDDGIGGADPVRGSGLLGLKDRAEAIGGTICVETLRGEGTSLSAKLPLGP